MDKIVRTFSIKIDFLGTLKSIEREIEFPFTLLTEEVSYQLIDEHQLLDTSFPEFIRKTEEEIYFSKFDECEMNDFSAYWIDSYKSNYAEYVSNITNFDHIIEFTDKFNDLLVATRQNELINLVTSYRRDLDEYYQLKRQNISKLKEQFLF
ncbi:hypothetical protein RF11_11547 [Thelohanellus kitauei]|uniref:Uncharacterized protein n=1 Tax=Thelohanellus kitauei TaxID=669202 RepID=A0A0C2IKF0_THEKT|nr:hypothetical protein RF11_11547 [Thelohanellus kitauei]